MCVCTIKERPLCTWESSENESQSQIALVQTWGSGECYSILHSNTRETSKQLILCYPGSHRIFNSHPKASIHNERSDERNRGKKLTDDTNTKQNSIFWPSDKETAWGPPLSCRAKLRHPAGGGGAFWLLFSTMPRWVALNSPKDIK